MLKRTPHKNYLRRGFTMCFCWTNNGTTHWIFIINNQVIPSANVFESFVYILLNNQNSVLLLKGS